MTAYRCCWTAGEVVTPSLEGKPPIPNYTNTGGWVTIHTDTKDQAERIMLSLLSTTTRPYRHRHPDCKVTVEG